MPGKAFTFVFVFVLALGVIFGLLIALRFQAIMDSLDVARSKWPRAAIAISEQATAFENDLAPIPTEIFEAGQSHPNAIFEDWKSTKEVFESVRSYEDQIAVLPRLIEMSKELDHDRKAASLSARVISSSDVKAFIDADESLDALQQDWLGRLSMSLLRLNIPSSAYKCLEDKLE